jgi:hypothetical protein
MKTPVRRASLTLSFLSLSLAACNNSTPTATIQLDMGGETGVFTRDPVPATITVDLVDSSGGRTQLFSGAVSDGITLADVNQSTEGYLDIAAADAAGAVRVRGRSLPVTFGALADANFNVFVQRTGELARLPGTMDTREAPLTSIVTGRYVLVAGGTAATTIYDVLTWSPLGTPPNLPRVPRTLAVSGPQVLVVDDAGASSYDLSSSSSSDVTVPNGGTLSEIIDGSTVYANDGTAYVIGGTRPSGDPTSRVLKISTDGTLSFVSLSSPRVGAAAVWVEGRGVVVIGGSATAPGIEVLGAGGTTAAALAYEPIKDVMLSAAEIDGGHVIAGAAPAIYDLSCVAACKPLAWAKPKTTLVHADYFPLPGLTTDILTVGWDAAGDTHVSRITLKTATEVPLKVARKRARGVAMPNGSIGIVGGGTTAESFIP